MYRTQKDTLPDDTQVFYEDYTPTTHFKPRQATPHTMPGAHTGRPYGGSNQRSPALGASARPLYYDDGYPNNHFGTILAEPPISTATSNIKYTEE